MIVGRIFCHATNWSFSTLENITCQVCVHCCTADLRWNNVGLVGGRALLSALDHNKTLKRLLLAGNNVPADVLRSVGIYDLHMLELLLVTGQCDTCVVLFLSHDVRLGVIFLKNLWTLSFFAVYVDSFVFFAFYSMNCCMTPCWVLLYVTNITKGYKKPHRGSCKSQGVVVFTLLHSSVSTQYAVQFPVLISDSCTLLCWQRLQWHVMLNVLHWRLTIRPDNACWAVNYKKSIDRIVLKYVTEYFVVMCANCACAGQFFTAFNQLYYHACHMLLRSLTCQEYCLLACWQN